MSTNKYFADAFNFYLFDGQPVISSENLNELDPNELLDVYGTSMEEKQIQKWRDILKSCVIKTISGMVLIILGIENQSEIHYAIPVRTMIYDALNYGSQVEEASRKHREKQKEGQKEYKNSAEFLSGFTKTDRLTPVITLTIYWGADEWDGPLCLSDMISDDYSQIKSYINDYKVHLIAPGNIEDFSKFKTELRAVLEFIKASKSKSEMEQAVLKNEMFRSLGRDSVSVINVFTGTKISLETGRENVDMCQAWEEQRLDGILEGKLELLHFMIDSEQLKIEQAAEMIGMTVAEFKGKLKEINRSEM